MPGLYKILWCVQVTEPGQLQLDINTGTGATSDARSTVGNQNPTAGGHLIVGNDFVVTTVINTIVRVINPAGNSPALTITPADGGSTHANAQSLIIEQLM